MGLIACLLTFDFKELFMDLESTMEVSRKNGCTEQIKLKKFSLWPLKRSADLNTGKRIIQMIAKIVSNINRIISITTNF